MKRETLLGLGALCALGLTAAPLTPQQALERLGSTRQGKAAVGKLQSTPVWTAKASNGTPTVYVFNSVDNKGYRVLAADDAAYAVLGYSDSGSIDVNNMSPEFKWWIEQLGNQIEYYVSRGATTSDEAAPAADDMERIEPLVQTKWDQDAPYNNDAPKIGSRTCYTGCVATSMAQVMNYHKYPEIGTGSITYTWSRNETQLSMDFSKQAFDWDNMLNIYQRNAYSTAQANAVSYLMKACGYSVQMNYGTSASGTQGSLICDALVKYFGYDGNCSVKWKVAYSASQWKQMVYDNLKNAGPVIMNGHPKDDSGHSFICDGYDGSSYFHFNWGWSGTSDGWYLLDAMNPGAQGIGGAAGTGGFDYGVNAIMGIQKPNGQPVATQYDNLLMYGGCTATVSSRKLSFKLTEWYPSGWFCAMAHPVKVNIGAIIEPVEGTPGETIERAGTFAGSTTTSLSPGSYYPTMNGPQVNLPTLADGKYKVTIGVLDKNAENAPRQPILCPYAVPNFVYLIVENGKITVENVPVINLTSENLTLDSPLYYGKMAKYTAKIKNDSEFELSEVLAPALLLDDKLQMVGNVAPTTVAPKTTADVEWVGAMTIQSGAAKPTTDKEYTLAVVNPITLEILGKYGTVTMKPQPKTTVLAPMDFVVDNCESVNETTETGTFNVYQVPDGNNFSATLTYEVYQGFFDGVLSVGIYARNPENMQEIEPIQPGIFQLQPFQENGFNATVNIPISFPEGEVGKMYMLRSFYTAGKSDKPLTSAYFKLLNSGVDYIEAVDQDVPVRYFNLQGMEIKTPAKGQIVIMKQGDKTRKVIF